MEDKLRLITARSALMTKLKRLQSELRPSQDKVLTIFEVEVCQEGVDTAEVKLNTIQYQLIGLSETEEDILLQIDAGEKLEDVISSCKVLIKTTLASLKPQPQPVSVPASTSIVSTQPAVTQSRVRLPKLDLPTFEGNYEEWMSFRDQFTSSIINNGSLSGSDRLQYLISCVKGEAAKGISSFPITNDSFEPAWTMLKDRYENTREIVFALVRKLMYQGKVQSENAAHLRKLVDTTMQCLRLLANLGRPNDQWDDILVFTLVEKLDPDSRREWAKTLKGTEMPKFKEVMDFLENHIRGLLASSSKPKSEKGSQGKSAHVASGKSRECPVCQTDHTIYKCQSFLDMKPKDRFDIVRKSNLCFNCLNKGHSMEKCNSKFTCRQCGGKHNTLLHREKEGGVDSKSSSNQQPQTSVQSNYVGGHGVILATAVIQMRDSSGAYQSVRAFLDPGSEASFVTDKCASRLGLSRKKCDVTISGIGSTNVCRAKGVVSCALRSNHSNFNLTVDALVLSQVTGRLPSFTCGNEWKNWTHIRDIVLADPTFYEPREVDILIGADATERIFTNNKLLGRPNEPIARSTEFGWVILGTVGVQVHTSGLTRVQVHSAHVELEKCVQQFWELENVPSRSVLTVEKQEAEDHFISNHYRDNNGRSRDVAESRLYQVERRLKRDSSRKDQYTDFMNEYIKLGHMEEVPPTKVGEALEVVSTYYLPHHFVLKEDSDTTKLRVVFDGSSRSSSSLSLNDCLMVGPTVQPDIFTHLLRFRQFQIALKADIAKMYRQFSVSLQDRDYQRILWRSDCDQPLKEYQLRTVTYGTSSAPFSATRCLNQLSEDGGESYPLGSVALRNNFYVDDLMTSVKSHDLAISLQLELDSLLGSSQLDLRQWDSNCKKFLSKLSKSKVKDGGDHHFSKFETSKALGVQWNSNIDMFSFPSYTFQVQVVTRKDVLSETARIFDPLGLLSPFTIRLKVFFQQLWLPVEETGKKLTWVDPIPSCLLKEWEDYRKSITLLNSISVPRCLSPAGFTKQEVHVFSDASEKAYSAVVYLRNLMEDGTTIIRLVAAKTKVAPLKATSLPRLELCGAHLASKLQKSVMNALNLDCPVHCWSDSEIVLSWVSSPSRRWATFVANRVSQIQELTESCSWHFVPGILNPADCASRGISIQELVQHDLWWDVPFLQKSRIPTFPRSTSFPLEVLEERKVKLMAANSVLQSLFQNFSTLESLQRRFIFILRFVRACREKYRSQSLYFNQVPTADERKCALWKCCFLSQEVDFADDLDRLKNKNKLRVNSRISQLNPFIDSHGLLRVGGRLEHANVSPDTKHQVILLGSTQLALLIVRQYHQKNHHAGPRLLHSLIFREFWIIRGKNLIKTVVRSCLVCRKWRGKTAEQIMGNLPGPRVNPSPPFTHTGVDYAGPFVLQTVKGRGNKQFKGYLCVFVCFAVKAVHIEVVSTQDTSSFIGAFQRFISRRGIPLHMYSDCGTNFKGAARELRQYWKEKVEDQSFLSFISDQGISWHFNSPSAPHHGGLWESAVKQVKFHLYRVTRGTTLTFEEFHTLTSQVEATLNSRPLTPLSDNPEEFDVLTPGHFLLGRPNLSLPLPNYLNTNENRLSRWQRQEKMFQDFWARWSQEYLITLQGRAKWRSVHKDIQVGDLVAIKDEVLPPLKWKLGRIIQTHPGRDGSVRVVSIRTATGTYQRPIVKLVLLMEADQLDPPISTSTSTADS